MKSSPCFADPQRGEHPGKAPEDVELGIAGKHVLPQVVSGIATRVGWLQITGRSGNSTKTTSPGRRVTSGYGLEAAIH